MMEEGAIIYEIDDVIYEQTKNKKIVMLNQSDTVGTEEMIGNTDTNLENLIDKFQSKSFDDKKKEIFEYLDDMKEKKLLKSRKKI